MSGIKNMEKNIETRPITTEMLSPRQFLKAQKDRPGSIKRAEFVRPHIGEKHFGKFRVTYKYPTYKAIERKG